MLAAHFSRPDIRAQDCTQQWRGTIWEIINAQYTPPATATGGLLIDCGQATCTASSAQHWLPSWYWSTPSAYCATNGAEVPPAVPAPRTGRCRYRSQVREVLRAARRSSSTIFRIGWLCWNETCMLAQLHIPSRWNLVLWCHRTFVSLNLMPRLSSSTFLDGWCRAYCNYHHYVTWTGFRKLCQHIVNACIKLLPDKCDDTVHVA